MKIYSEKKAKSNEAVPFLLTRKPGDKTDNFLIDKEHNLASLTESSKEDAR